MRRNLKFLHMWINFTFHHMTDVEKSGISFIMCTIYGILLHFTLLCCKKLSFLRFTLFFEKSVCCNVRAIVWRKFLQKLVTVEKKWQISGMLRSSKRTIHIYVYNVDPVKNLSFMSAEPKCPFLGSMKIVQKVSHFESKNTKKNVHMWCTSSCLVEIDQLLLQQQLPFLQLLGNGTIPWFKEFHMRRGPLANKVEQGVSYMRPLASKVWRRWKMSAAGHFICSKKTHFPVKLLSQLYQ